MPLPSAVKSLPETDAPAADAGGKILPTTKVVEKSLL